MAELKSCPFCGGIPDIGIFDDEGNIHNEIGYEKDPWSGLVYGIVHDDTNANDEDFDCPIVSVLCRMPGEKPFLTVHEGYISDDGVWVSNFFKREPGEVTHWAEMPTYPGDEEK